MKERLSRRDFMKIAAAGTGVAAGAQLLDMPYILAAPAPTGDQAKLRTAVIGCGGRGISSHVRPAAREHLVALVDPDEKNLEAALKKAAEEPGVDPSKIRTFTDYRKFFDAMNKEVDAVFIATPNHHHALPALIAMQHGIGVYVEKPLAFNIDEARTMGEYARRYKAASQMGNQGHSGEGYRRLCEYIWAGAIGNVTEVYHWTNRANGGTGARPPALPIPAGLHWDEWIGPAPMREYHKDLHPHEWHNWHDFGNGSLGNMASHIMDGAFWALKLNRPTSIEVEEALGGSHELYPVGTRIRWDFPARGEMAPVKVYWYDGKRKGIEDAGKGDIQGSVSKQGANMPPIMEEMEKLTGRKFRDGATFYVGDKGIMYTGTYGEGVRILPEEKHLAFKMPEPIIPRVKDSHQGNFLAAVRGGPPAVANFDYAAPFAEMVLLGDLAIKAGVGQKVEWDGNKCTNRPELNRFLKRQARKGWEY
ncbi:MAG: hypothetical protein JWN98_1708 [Abditibacteriota bacterium]|nr:hypothetical protein [Abditibacteriota bacterium]